MNSADPVTCLDFVQTMLFEQRALLQAFVPCRQGCPWPLEGQWQERLELLVVYLKWARSSSQERHHCLHEWRLEAVDFVAR